MKKKVFSKSMSWVLSVMMIYGVFSVIIACTSITASAITRSEVESKLQSLISEYAGRKATSDQMYMGSQCKGFANWVFLQIFDVYIGPYPENAKYKTNTSTAEVLGELDPGYLNEESCKELLQKGAPGDFIQVQRSTARGSGPHSMILVSVNNDGIEVFDANSDGQNTIKNYFISYSAFDVANKGMSLCRAKNYDPTPVLPTNARADKNQNWYDLNDTITIWAYADNASDFEMVIDDSSGNRLVNFYKMDGNSYSIPVSQLGGIGDYYFCIIAKNSAGGTQSEWYTIPVVGNPSYSDVRASKQLYTLEDTVEISVDTICAKGQVIGIDKEGVGRVVTENCEPTFSIPAIQLGVGNYSAYFTVYNGSGGIDTQRVNFEITDVNISLGREFSAMILNTYSWKPIQNCDDGRVRLATSSVYNIDSIVWNFKQNDNGSYTIISFKDGKVLDVTGGSGEDCTPIGCYISNGTPAQQWFLIKRSDGTYYLQALCTSGIMDVKNGVLEDGSEIQTYTSNASAAQIFSIYFINPNDDKTDYTITSTLAQINIGQTTDIVIEGKVPYVYNYKFHIKTPTGEENIIDNKCNPVYKFTGAQLGKYIVWAEVTNPVSSETGSETNKYITITVKETHDYITKVIAPTCTEEGYTLHTCKNCSNSYKDTYTDPTGHKYTETVVEPTVSEKGYTLHTCSKCGHSYKDNYTNKLLVNTTTIAAEDVKLGSYITINASATGGTGDYTYAVWYKQSSASSWTTKQNYSTNATIKIKPASAEKYDISVKVKDSEGTIVKKSFTVNVFAPLKNTTTVSSTSIGYGGTFTVKAKATGGLGDYTYAVYYKKASATKWTTAQNYSSTKTVTIKPKYAEEYDVSVKVKDSRGVVAKKTFKIKVTKPTNTSKVASTTITLGNTIDITCSATGGSGFYQYAVYYKKSSADKWNTKQSYSSNTNVSIKPASKTKYDVSVKVKDSLGNVTKKAFTITVK